MIKNQTCQKDNDFLPQLKLLPNTYQQIGIWLAVISFMAMFAIKFIVPEMETIRLVLKKVFLVSLLLISISKDSIEDELTFKLRAQAFAVAFIWGVLYALVQPYFDFLIDLVFKPEGAAVTDLSAVQIITFMLLIQIGFYQLLKRKR